MMTRPALDLSKAHFKRVKGDLTVIGTWLIGNDAPEPALVLVPSHAEGFERVTPCVVPLSAAWIWSEESGDPVHAARQSYTFAKALNVSAENVYTCMRISSLIRNHLGDLVAMPPMPKDGLEVVADALRVDEDGTEHYAEILDRV